MRSNLSYWAWCWSALAGLGVVLSSRGAIARQESAPVEVPAGASATAAESAAGAAALAAPGDPATEDGASSAAGEPAPPAVDRSISFNFKGATFEQVIDFFSRQTGLPVVWECAVPAGTLDFISPESYSLAEGLTVLNILLQSKGVMLRIEDSMLYLQTLTDMARENIPTFVDDLPEDVTDDQIVTVVRPLTVAMAAQVAEKLAGMVAPYGSVIAMPAQNSLVITETAAQVRRLTMIIDELDRADPEGAIEIIPVVHTRASIVIEPLRALLATRVEKYVIDQKGNQIKIQEDSLAGLNLTVDDRTNAIVAKGVQSRIDQLKSALALLDVPARGQSRTVRTIDLARLSADEAVAQVEKLFAKLPEDQRPTVLPQRDLGRLTIIGMETAVGDAADLLRQIDGGGESVQQGGSRMDIIPLAQGRADGILALLKSLLTPRQQAVIRVLAGPDGRSIVLSGPVADVESVRAVVPLLDARSPSERQVRQLKLTARDPSAVLTEAKRLFDLEQAARGDESSLTTELDAAGRTLTLVGAPDALERFARLLRSAEEQTVVERETRQLRVSRAKASEVVTPLRSLSAQLLTPHDGSSFVAPEFEAIDVLDTVIARAEPGHFSVIESLLATLDQEKPSDYLLHVTALSGVEDVAVLLERTKSAWDRLVRGYPADERPLPEIEHDALTGNLIVSGRVESVRLYEQALQEARKLLPPPRSGELLTLTYARAADVVGPLRETLARIVPADRSRTVTPPSIEVIERTNSIFITAEPAQHPVIARLIRELDTLSPADLPPLRLLQVRAADAPQLAQMLRTRYESRPGELRRTQPVTIDADAATNTLVVTAHEQVFEEIREFVQSVNSADQAGPQKETMIFPIRRARAADLAVALEKLYPDPPTPLDRRGRALPDLKPPREVYVSADAATNTLIIEAPAERRASFTALVEQLDRIELPPLATLRTYRVERGDPNLIARTLTELARRGVLSAQPTDGSKPVEVLIQAEPTSRTLIVAGDDVTFRETEAILKDLEVVAQARTLRVVEVENADPQEIAQQAQRLYEQQIKDVPGASPVTVEVDRASGAILVVAPDEALARFTGIISQLLDSVGPAPEVQLITLEHARAADVVEFLRDLATTHATLTGSAGAPAGTARAPVFEAIERSNAVLVAARREQHDIIRALVRSYDRPDARQLPPLRILQVRTADAPALADALARKYAQRPLEDRNQRPVDITADPQTNALLVAAHPELLPEIEAIVEQLNSTARVDTTGREIRIFPLKVARAEELARTLDEMFPEPPVPVDARGRPLPQLREPREVVVRADAQTNSIIVDAPVQRLAGFEQLVEQLDRQRFGEDSEIRVYPVTHADIEMLAQTMQQLAQSGTLVENGGDRRVPLTIKSDPNTRSLVVSGPVEAFARVEQVLKSLDVRKAAPATSLRLFPLKSARADTLAEVLRGLLVTRLQHDLPQGTADAQALLQVTSDRKTNTLILQAPDALMPVAEEIIRQLDDGTASLGNPVVRVHPLNFADAVAVTTALTSALPGTISRETGEPINLRLIPVAGSNAVIMVGLPMDVEDAAKLIEPLDARPATDGVDAVTFELRHADASTIAPMVRNLLTDQQQSDPRIVMERIRRSRGEIDLTPPIRVEADVRSNSLIVSGPQQTVALARTIIERLDAAGDGGGRTWETFTASHADAKTLMEMTTRMMSALRPGGRRTTLEIIHDPSSNALLLAGSQEDVNEAKAFLNERDASFAAAPAMEFRIVSLAHAPAMTVAEVLRPMLLDRSRWPASLRAKFDAGIGVSAPSVTADTASNRLLISAPQELLPLAQSLVTAIDEPAGAEARSEVRLFTLERADASQAAAAVRSAIEASASSQPGRPVPTVIAESSSNSLLVTATRAQMAEIEAIVAGLDKGYRADQSRLRTIVLKHAVAVNIAPLVKDLLAPAEEEGGANWWFGGRRGAAPAEAPEVRVVADARLNALIVSAPAPLLDLAEEMIAELDREGGGPGGEGAGRTLAILTIENADAAQIAASLEGLFSDSSLGEAAPIIKVDASSNTLLVRASRSQHEAIAQVVERVDRAALVGARQMRTIAIDPGRADAARVAQALRDLLDREGAGKVEVIPLDELLRRHSEPAATQDKGGPASAPPAEGGAFWLPRGPEELVFVAVLGLADEEPRETGPAVSIGVDSRTNSLVIVGSPRALERVAALAEQLQRELPQQPGTVRAIALPPDLAVRNIAELVKSALAGIFPAPAGTRGAAPARVSVIADEGSNALIVIASDKDFDTVASLVAAVARPPAGETVSIKVYPLQSISADRAAASLRQLTTPIGEGDAQTKRLRSVAVRLLQGDQQIETVLRPGRISVVPDAAMNSLVVSAPADALTIVDAFVSMLDQAPAHADASLRLIPLQHAPVAELGEALRDVMRVRHESLARRGEPGVARPELAWDERTSTLIVSAAPEQMGEIEQLIAQLDRPTGAAREALRIVSLNAAQPSTAARLLRESVLGGDQQAAAATTIVADDASGILLVRATPEVNAEIDRVLAQIDRDASAELAPRTIVLERADAKAVAAAVQKFFDDRAKITSTGRGRRDQSRRISIVGDAQSRTLLIAASDDDFAQIEELVRKFDSPQATNAWAFRVIPLEHAKASDLGRTISDMIETLSWDQSPFRWWGGDDSSERDRGSLAVQADDRLNALIATGEGDKFQLIEDLVEVLDVPASEGAERQVRVYRIEKAGLATVRDVLDELFGSSSSNRRWWEPEDPRAVRIRVDERSGSLLIAATPREHAEIQTVITGIEAQTGAGGEEIAVLPLRYAAARDIAQTLSRFLEERADAGGDASGVVIAPSESANALVVSAAAAELESIRGLLTQLDQPDASGERVVELVSLKRSAATDIARIVRDQFASRSGGAQGLVITSDDRTNTLVVNAPSRQFEKVRALIEQLDQRVRGDETLIRTYELKSAQADDVQRILTESLQLDDSGQTTGTSIRLDESSAAVEVRARIVADRRSNSIIVTATPESIPIIESLIGRLDDVPAAVAAEYYIVRLKHAMADEVALTLGLVGNWGAGATRPNIDYNRLENQLIIAATPDQYTQITRLLEQIDQPTETARRTDFVPLQFAEAEMVQKALSVFYGPSALEADTPQRRNTRIVADPATNSLVISADEGEWESIRALLTKLDSAEYDASLQLEVIPLRHADAVSVAAAINQAFERPQGEAPKKPNESPSAAGNDPGRRDETAPTVLVAADEWVRASAESKTNSIVVSASRQNQRKIAQIITELDVADYAKLPPPRLIPVPEGDPVALAEAISRLYMEEGGQGRSASSPRSIRIAGLRDAQTIIVRVEDSEFMQIEALAAALREQSASGGVGVHVMRLASAGAKRVADAIRPAFEAKARRGNVPFSMQVDTTLNALVIAAPAALVEEVRATVNELDAMAPGAGQGIFFIELQHIDPSTVRSVIETIGLNQRPAPDSSSRLLTEPLRAAVVPGRRAILIVGSPADQELIVGFIKGMDVEPPGAEAITKVIMLRRAAAPAVATMLTQMLSPASPATGTPLARAAQEQIRRLSVRRTGVDEPDLRLDLTKGTQVIPHAPLNAIVISSTEENVAAVSELVALLDELPLSDAVTVQIFPLENIAAEDFRRIVSELFQQGKRLSTIPGTTVVAASGSIGRAFLDEVALSIDARTNTIVAAGREESVALVEVMVKRLDAETVQGWLEPRILPLRHADAKSLAEMLQGVLVDGNVAVPQASPLQRQVGRLRMAQTGNGEARVLESGIFQPMTRLVIRPEPQMNALVLVGSPANLDVVTQLVAMLDVEAASPESSVRIYPVTHASAARLSGVIAKLFDDQVRSKALRDEDRVSIQSDERTNALIVSTSPRSFAILESLLKTLDTEIAPDLREIRRIEIVHASANRLAGMIQQLMDSRLERLRKVRPELADLERATIVADPRTNSLVVAAGNEAYDVIKQLAADLDQSTIEDNALLQVIPLRETNVDRIATTITRLMQRRYAEMPPEVRGAQEPLVMTDARSNSLLVAANPEDLAAIESLVQRLEAVPSNPAVGLHVINLPSSTNAQALSERVQRLMNERASTLGESKRPSDAVTVEAEPNSNALVVAASPEHLEVVQHLVDLIVTAGEDAAAGRTLDVIALKSGRAAPVANMVEEMYARELNEQRGVNAVQVSADERTNSVIVRGGPDEIRSVRELVERLDSARPANTVEIKYVSLQSANALETVGLINSVLEGRGLGARRNSQQATVLRYLRQMNDGTEDPPPVPLDDVEVSSAIRESITLTPDVRTNTIIVSAPTTSMQLIEQMIRDLDTSTTGAKSIRIFKLENADAIAMRDILTELFNLRQGNELLVLKPREGGDAGSEAGGVEGGAGEGFLGGTELTAVPDERQQLSITVDSRTNSLLVSGSPTYLDLVDEVVQKLDAISANERDVYVYQLRNSKAEDVARVLEEFVRKEQEKLVGTLSEDQLGSAARLLEREITIQGDIQSNSVLVSASPRYMDLVKDMLGQLDVDPPQVLIQVMLAEVTLDAGDEFGVDMNLRVDADGTEGTAGFGFARTFLTGAGIPTLSIAATDFDMMLRAMKSQGRLQVLSNPSIMAANNQPAELQVGETIRVPESSSFTGTGQTNTDTIEKELGIILNVTPSINPDGFVRMTVEPHISSLTQRTTQINESLSSPVIDVRRAKTTVTVHDGQTIVIGGLISDRYERRDRRVPLLSEIPIFGELFKSHTELTAKTEFLIVLTPHVITSPSDYTRVDSITGEEVRRLTLPESVKRAIREGRFDLGDGIFDASGRPIEVDFGEDESAPPLEGENPARDERQGEEAPSVDPATTAPDPVPQSRPQARRRGP